jgi:hypothetical protein
MNQTIKSAKSHNLNFIRVVGFCAFYIYKATQMNIKFFNSEDLFPTSYVWIYTETIDIDEILALWNKANLSDDESHITDVYPNWREATWYGCIFDYSTEDIIDEISDITTISSEKADEISSAVDKRRAEIAWKEGLTGY